VTDTLSLHDALPISQPVLVLRFEASTEERLQAIRGMIEKVLENIMRNYIK
jgi:hypothetical protein